MKTFPLVLIGVSLLLPGCSKKETAATTKTNQLSSGNPITAPVDYLGAVAKAKRVSEKVVDTAEVTKAIQLFYGLEDRFPRDLNELVTSHHLARIPDPPPGYRWQYNPQNGELRAVR